VRDPPRGPGLQRARRRFSVEAWASLSDLKYRYPAPLPGSLIYIKSNDNILYVIETKVIATFQRWNLSLK
jgi:hypothetical protein